MRRFLQNLFRADRSATPVKRTVRLGLDRLDDRLVPALMSYNTDTGVLAISGNDLPDHVSIYSESGWDRYVDVWVNGQYSQFDRVVSRLTRIQCSLGGGIDSFHNETNIPCNVSGGAEADTIIGGTGTNVLDGGGGNDYLEARAPFVDGPAQLSGNRLYGGPGNDTIVGSDRPDYIDGGEDEDTIHADHPAQAVSPRSLSEFGDEVHGGPGNDTIYGYRGNDRLFGEAGGDDLMGMDGFDYLDAGRDFARDHLSGGAGTFYTDWLVMYEYATPGTAYALNLNFGTAAGYPDYTTARQGSPMYPSFDTAEAPLIAGDWRRNMIDWVHMDPPANLTNLSLAGDVFSLTAGTVSTTSTTQTLSTSASTTLSTYTYQGTGSIWAG